MRIFVCLFVLFSLAACVETPTARPPLTGRAQLDFGRHVYATRCSKCHALPVPSHYDAVAWRNLMNDMAPQAGLKPAERAAVDAYVKSAFVFME